MPIALVLYNVVMKLWQLSISGYVKAKDGIAKSA